MVGLLGGRAAEELVFDDITSGASNDLERVTRMARAMVTRLGMSDQLGPMVYGQKEELIFLGREISEQRDYSEAVAEEIDHEVRRMVNEAYETAKSHPHPSTVTSWMQSQSGCWRWRRSRAMSSSASSRHPSRRTAARRYPWRLSIEILTDGCMVRRCRPIHPFCLPWANHT